MKNLFLKNKDGDIFKVKHICMCDECKKRQMPELCLEDMNGNYVDYIKVSDLFSSEWILAKDFYKL